MVAYCGRKDLQIKLRGQHIEFGEVEDVVDKYSGITRSAVLVRTLHDAPAIVAFVKF
jgi:acyl-coenzyme A synthetase/AMP-(fatty) acid ligase